MTAIASPLEDVVKRVGSLWWTLLVAGIAWIVIGFVVLRFDRATVDVIAIVAGLLVLAGGAGELLRAMMSTGGWRVWHIVFAVLLVLGAIAAFAHPGDTFVTLALVTGFYFVAVGTADVISSLLSTAVPGWWLGLLSGIAEIVLGFLASSSYSSSVFVLVTYVSIVAIFRGVAEIAAGIAIRSAADL